ncbi:MAG: electron transfer flavoprotein subunit alpha, partial [Acidobacteria bacterium RIFCSPLOWO2_12_FULL_54_10]
MSEAILAILEQSDGKLHRMSWETLAAAQKLSGELSRPVEALLLGNYIQALAEELSSTRLACIRVIEDQLLQTYTPDGYAIVLRQVIERQKPYLVLLPHTYQVRDFAPKLATALGRPLLSDCIGFRQENGELIFTRQLFQGKINADFSYTGDPPFLASLQAGSFRGDQVAQAESKAPVELEPAHIAAEQIRTKPTEKFQEARQTVNLAQADIIVAVGRGIKEHENLALVQKLADALGAEIGGSRPVCDSGWLPMERQIGSSGQTVAPKLYIAVGISGAIQHLVGMKSSRTVVAINKDASAPIFEIADYGIVG